MSNHACNTLQFKDWLRARRNEREGGGVEKERESKREVHLSGMKERLLVPHWIKGLWLPPTSRREEVLVLFCGIKSLLPILFQCLPKQYSGWNAAHALDYARGKLYYDFKARVSNLEKTSLSMLDFESIQPKTSHSSVQSFPQSRSPKTNC